MESYDILCPKIKKFERDIISMNLCAIFAKTNFVEDAEQLRMVIQNEAERLSKIEEMSISEFMEIAIELIEGVIAAESRYILLGTYKIRPELILINRTRRKFGKVKLIWESDQVNAKKEIIEVLKFMANLCIEKNSSYITKICDIATREHSGLHVILHRIKEVQREYLLVNTDYDLSSEKSI